MIKKVMRRHFQGRITDNGKWQQKLETICRKWLIKTPTLSASDDGKKHRKKSIQVWQTGSLIQALREVSGNSVILENAPAIHREFDTDSIRDADYGLLCFSLSGFPEFEPLQSAMLQYIEENQVKSGLIRYKTAVKSTVFVDTLGFVCPFLSEYGISHNRPALIDLAKKQIEFYLANGAEPNSGLPFHAFELEHGTLRGICDWARGLAWLLIALMDSYLCLRAAGKSDAFYEEKICFYAELLLTLQKSSGAYSWMLLSSQQPSDSSATAVFGWFLASAHEIFQNEAYLTAARKCRDYLKSVTFSDGSVDYCQGDTISVGLYSRSFGKMPFAQGFALRMQVRLKQYDA